LKKVEGLDLDFLAKQTQVSLELMLTNVCNEAALMLLVITKQR
jgi:ATP-dependent Zn protease